MNAPGAGRRDRRRPGIRAGAGPVVLVALTAALAAAPATAAPPTELRGEADDDPRAREAELERARIAANDDPHQAADELSARIEAFEAGRALPLDDASQALRLRALLTLARAYASADRPQLAATAMDRALRSALGGPVSASAFGPATEHLAAARRDALGAPGVLELRCAAPCTAVVEGRALPGATAALLPGSYALHIGATAADALKHPAIDLQILPGQTTEIEWAPPPPPPAAPRSDAAPAPLAATSDGPAPTTRLLPRWAEIGGLVLGVGAMAAGAALLAIDGGCPGGEAPTDVEACPEVYTTALAGAATLATGGVVTVTAATLLTVDELRIRRPGDAPGGSPASVSVVFGYRARF